MDASVFLWNANDSFWRMFFCGLFFFFIGRTSLPSGIEVPQKRCRITPAWLWQDIFPAAVSPVSIREDAPSKTALNMSLTSARVGTGCSSMDASIWGDDHEWFFECQTGAGNLFLDGRKLWKRICISQVASRDDDLVAVGQKGGKLFHAPAIFDFGKDADVGMSVFQQSFAQIQKVFAASHKGQA